jgi:hypothetical protein
MQRILAFTMASLICVGASAAQWLPLAPQAYFLKPQDNQEIVALANRNGNEINVTLLERSSSECKGRATSELVPEGPYRVNGTNINFQSACFDGDKVIAAVSQAGKDFLMTAITTGPAKVEMRLGVVLHFNSENFEEAKEALLDMRPAL